MLVLRRNSCLRAIARSSRPNGTAKIPIVEMINLKTAGLVFLYCNFARLVVGFPKRLGKHWSERCPANLLHLSAS
jgi:hypothetical protein